jgi:hypothetical protein
VERAEWAAVGLFIRFHSKRFVAGRGLSKSEVCTGVDLLLDEPKPRRRGRQSPCGSQPVGAACDGPGAVAQFIADNSRRQLGLATAITKVGESVLLRQLLIRNRSPN